MKRAIGILTISVICTSAFALTATDRVKINELYFAGGDRQDGFIELYNAGEDTAYLDGALIVQGPDTFAQLVFKFPGSPGETNHSLAAGAFAVIAIDAQDFSQDDPPGLNLTYAAYETYWDYETEPGDNSAAVNLLEMVGLPFDWFFVADHGQVLLTSGYAWTVQPCDPGETCGDVAYSVSFDDIVDGVEYSYQPLENAPILRDDIDAGVVAGIAPDSYVSAERIAPGHDSNNSTFDFIILANPSPGYHSALSADDPPPLIAQSLQFDAIYPNPFNSGTRISFKLPQAGTVQLIVYDILGNPVRTLLTGRLEAGAYDVAWDGTGRNGSLPTGVYIARLSTAGGEAAGKIILSR